MIPIEIERDQLWRLGHEIFKNDVVAIFGCLTIPIEIERDQYERLWL